MPTETTVVQQPVFSDIQAATNMPFFDGKTLVFCQSGSVTEKTLHTKGLVWNAVSRNALMAERFKDLPRTQQMKYRAWKLAYCNLQNKVVHSIATGLPDDVTERSPSFYWEGKRVHLSFVAGTSTIDGPRYKLYSCSGFDFDHLGVPKPISNEPLIFGFVSPKYICHGIRNIIQIKEKHSRKSYKLKTGFSLVSSVTYLAEDPGKLLITGKDKEHNHHTVLYDLASGDTADIAGDGPVYKSTLHNDLLIHAHKLKEGYENRQLFQSSCSKSRSSVQILKLN